MFAKKSLVKIAILLIAGTALLSSVCFATGETRVAEQQKPREVKVHGVVNVTKDANDVIVEAAVVTEEVVYNVVLNAKGLELGKTMADKEVEVQGVVSKQGDQNWIEVHSYKLIEKAPETE